MGTTKALIIFALIVLAMNLLLPKSNLYWGDGADYKNAMIADYWGAHYAEYEADLAKRCEEERARPTR